MRLRQVLVGAGVVTALLSGAAVPSGAAARGPAVLVGRGVAATPEGAAWDAVHHRFLVGSMVHGTVSAVRPDGSLRTLVDDPALITVVGLHADPARGRVLVANADLGVGERTGAATVSRTAGLGAYDLRTGRRTFYADLAAVAGDGGPHLANDVAFAPDGTAYVTDTYAPIVYRVTPDGAASVLVRDPRLAAPAGAIGLNGIVWQDGVLVVGKTDDASLWRLPPDRPEALSRIDVPDAAGRFTGLDGLLARPDGSLLAVTNRLGGTGSDALLTLRTTDGWHTARTAAVRPVPDTDPTAVTAGPGNGVWVLSARLDLLLAGAPGDGFTLRRTG
ncbi:SMP-30/gluconolactonase/LRE family protein [Streptomyces sp. TLI_171]|uniref:SMP-30/gluconolactonase/LRE family protein n=1 Tax=Streptomyces sp. TLI_171 TaxID=1938859 RepID=UPI000C4AC373|nr:SMP-30/gluconolactonase/LRE family protein [Streptomyces sp. TLI_171]RKE18513.1 sugar lactone lactonase YvrE [Streptomyces sp. TLI_171]